MDDGLHREYRKRQAEIDAWAATAVSAIADSVGGLSVDGRQQVFMEVLHIWGRVKADDYSPMPSPLQRFMAKQDEFAL